MLGAINNRRPDRKLERSLVFLAYAVMFMSLGLFAFFLYPRYSFYAAGAMVVWNIICILATIHILKVSESAIGFGTLASEILNDRSKYCRVDNAAGEAIIVNKAASEYFKNVPVLEFLQNNIQDTQACRMDLQKLSSAIGKLQPATVTLAVKPRPGGVYVSGEWLKVSVKPIYLNKTDIFEHDYSPNKIRRETYLFWSVENVTAYKNMDETFRREMLSLQQFLDFLPVGVYSCNEDGKIEYINNALAEKLGTDKNDAIGRTVDDFVLRKAELLHAEGGECAGNVVFKTADGEEEMFVRQTTVRDNGEIKTRGAAVWGIPGDSELRSRADFLESRLGYLLDTVPLGIVLTDGSLHIKEINAYALDLLGRGRQDSLEGQLFCAYLEDGDAAKISAALKSPDGKMQGFDTMLKTDSEEKNVRITAGPVKDAVSDDGRILFYLQDTTRRRSLEMQIAQAQKMQTFGQMAGGVAHDFNNLLTAIVGYCDLLLRRHGIGDPSFADLIELKNNVNRASEIARQLLTISRKQPLNPKLIEVTEAFTDNEHLISRVIGEKIRLQINYGSDLGYIRVDTVQLSQVLLNLAINARDAMNGEGTLTLSARVEYLNEPYPLGDETAMPGDYAVLSVSDTGCGIPPENMERIFEPFFSTKKNIVNSGTGLGLSMVYNIVRQMDGFIKVESKLGKGTTFEVYLPSRDKNDVSAGAAEVKTAEAPKVQPAPMQLNSGSQNIVLGMNISEFDSKRSVLRNPGEIKILFVDDEDAVRIVGARGLRQKGYDVVDCISAENALEHIEAGEKFDLVITDMMMPGMSGAELAGVIKSKCPGTEIILASGYSEEIARKELAGSQDFYFIGKPYGLDNLNKKVKEVLADNDKLAQ